MNEVSPPTEEELAKVEAKLRRRPPGTQLKVGGEVYLRLDGEGRRRFHYRGLNGIQGGTRDSWQEAHEARKQVREEAQKALDVKALLGALRLPAELGRLRSLVARMDRDELRKLPLVYYAAGAYWPDMQTKLELITRLDYQADLALLVRLAGHLTLGELQEKPLLVSELKDKVVTLKTFPDDHPRAGQVATAAADDILSIGSAVCQHAQSKGVIFFNPFSSVARMHRPRSRGNGDGGTYAQVKDSEIKSPLTVVEVGLGMRGSGAQLWQRRLIPVLIALGLRPEDICAMRHCWWRDDRGPREKIEIEEAVKNVAGHLFTGQPKTGTRELHLFAFVAFLLECLYQAQGEPGLSALAFPGVHGGLLQWGNWVSNVWYPALYRSGVARTLPGDERRYPTDGIDAFDPYLLRHVGVITMLHALALEQDGRPARYSEPEVARQFGHTTATLSRVYGGIPQDMHRVRGKFMSEIFEQAWHEIWGPMPGEEGYEEVLLTTPQASALIAAHAETDARFKPVSVNSLGGRIARGSLPALQSGSRYLLSEWNLAWHGLIPPVGSGRPADDIIPASPDA
jgi:hypothetical protein